MIVTVLGVAFGIAAMAKEGDGRSHPIKAGIFLLLAAAIDIGFSRSIGLRKE